MASKRVASKRVASKRVTPRAAKGGSKPIRQTPTKAAENGAKKAAAKTAVKAAPKTPTKAAPRTPAKAEPRTPQEAVSPPSGRPRATIRDASSTPAFAEHKAAATSGPIKIATFNVNGVKSRLPHLLQWLQQESPDVVCLQELKSLDSAFPIAEIRAAGYGAIWRGQRSWNGVAILAKGADPIALRRALPGDEADDQSRYLEAAVNGMVVSCLYLPNGNPQPGPKFDYKLAWFERLITHAQSLFTCGQPVVMAGDYNVVPTDFDIYDPKSWKKDALLQPESRACYQRLLQQGWLDAIRAQHPEERVYTFWDYFRQHWQRNSGLRIDHLLLNPQLAPRLLESGVDRWVRDLDHASDHAPTWITVQHEGLGEATGKVKKRK